MVRWTSHRNSGRKPIAARLLEPVMYCCLPIPSVHGGSLALIGPQTNSSSDQAWLSSAKAAPEPNAYRCNLRGRGSRQLGPMRRNMQTRTSARPLLGILAERTGLIAKKGPPRLCWPSAWCGQVTRYGGLGDREPEHEKLTMDSRRTPEKVLAGHLRDQTADLTRNPRTPTAPATI